ncbi:MAG: hypothetical protein WCT08_05350 [Patescibacteria group bacterium]|jgi:sugar lactone lactonase YvrE
MKLYLKLIFPAIIICAVVLFFPKNSQAAYGDTSTFLGKIYAGDGLTRTQALLDFCEDVEITADGTFYIADTYNNVIRKVTPAGLVSTYAGTGEYAKRDGVASQAAFALPRGLDMDSDGNLYVADSGNNRIRKIKTNGTVSTIVSKGLDSPQGVLVIGSTLYIADYNHNAIKKVSVNGGILSLVSNNVKKPKKLEKSADENYLYVANSGTYQVLKVGIANGSAEIIAGSGSAGYWEGIGQEAQFRNIYGVTRAGDKLYVSDGDGLTDYVRSIDLNTRQTALLASDSKMLDINFPMGLRVYGDYVYVANAGIGTIHRFSKTDPGNDNEIWVGSTRFGDAYGAKANVLLGRPSAMAITKDGSIMYAAENNHIIKILMSTGETTNVIGDVIDGYGEGPYNQASPKVRFSTVGSILLSPDESLLYVVDRWNNRIRQVTLTGTPTASLITGAGLTNSNGSMNNGLRDGAKCVTESLAQAGCAYFRGPRGSALSPDGSTLYVADTGNNAIRTVRLSDGQVTTLAGSTTSGFADGTGTSAKFNSPVHLAISEDGATLFVADMRNYKIRAINTSTTQVTTLAGSRQSVGEGIGSEAAFSMPIGLAMGPSNMLYIADNGSSNIYVANTKTKLVTLVAGSTTRGYKDGARLQAAFNDLTSLTVSPDGQTLYVADSWNDVIRAVDIVGGPKFSQPGPVYSRFMVAKLKQAKSSNQTAYLDIYGKNFRNGAVATIGKYKLKTFVKKSTNINMIIPWGKMQPGYYDVKIRNRDSQQIIKKSAFAITDSKGNIPKKYFRISN